MVINHFGVRIIESGAMTIRLEVPTVRSVKRQFRKPWVKLKWRIITQPSTTVLRIDDMLICHPVIARQLRKELDGHEKIHRA